MSKMINCKACGKEIAKGVKKCVHCGKDQRNFFMKHKILSVVLAFVVLGGIGSALGENEDGTVTTTTTTAAADTTKPAETTTVSEPKATEPTIKKYTDGKYLVNKDIESGLYKVTLTDTVMKMGYVERAKDLDMELDSILANILLSGNGYVEILPTDVAVKLQGVEIEPVNIKNLKPAIKNEASDGIYLVGYDLAVGTYKVEVTDTVMKMGYVERSRSVAMGMDDIIANEIIQGPGYVKIQEGDFAVRLQGVKITIQK